jgi:hypothetical protein
LKGKQSGYPESQLARHPRLCHSCRFRKGVTATDTISKPMMAAVSTTAGFIINHRGIGIVTGQVTQVSVVSQASQASVALVVFLVFRVLVVSVVFQV